VEQSGTEIEVQSLTPSLECQFKGRGLAQIKKINPNNFLSGLVFIDLILMN
jgi:hypothetical protein